MKQKHRRLLYLIFLLALLSLAVFLVLSGFKEGVSYFYTPSEIVAGKVKQQKQFRLGGVVKLGTLQKTDKGAIFTVTDFDHDIVVEYNGILPNLFREDSGVIATGKMEKNGEKVFIADELLARHDENYIPKELESVLKKGGYWRDEK